MQIYEASRLLNSPTCRRPDVQRGAEIYNRLMRGVLSENQCQPRRGLSIEASGMRLPTLLWYTLEGVVCRQTTNAEMVTWTNYVAGI